MINQKPIKKNLIPTAIYLAICGVIIEKRKQGLVPDFAFNFAILNIVFGYWGMEFKGLKFYVEYLFLFAVYFLYMLIGSASMVLYKGSLPLSRVEFWLATFLISAILFIFHISSFNFKMGSGLAFNKQCIVNKFVLFGSFVLQVYLITN